MENNPEIFWLVFKYIPLCIAAFFWIQFCLHRRLDNTFHNAKLSEATHKPEFIMLREKKLKSLFLTSVMFSGISLFSLFYFP